MTISYIFKISLYNSQKIKRHFFAWIWSVSYSLLTPESTLLNHFAQGSFTEQSLARDVKNI